MSGIKIGKTGVSSRSFNLWSKIKGYRRLSMVTYSLNKYDSTTLAKFRLKVIDFHNRFGTKATLAAFPVKRSTIFVWKKRLRESKGRLFSLVPKSTRPKNLRRMLTHPLILTKIEGLRKKHYRLGKGKIIKRHHMFYQRSGYGYHNPNRKKYQYQKKARVNKSPKPEQGGKLSKYALECFKEFTMFLAKTVKIKTVQTDNDSEFAGLFNQYLNKRKIKHVWTYPNCPKINGCIERYNRSIQEEWLNSYLNEIEDTKQFNKRLCRNIFIFTTIKECMKACN